jgi:polyferredoxin
MRNAIGFVETVSPQLRAIKLIHTVVWAFFAGCILAIPLLTWRGATRAAVVCAAVVLLEVAVLLLNRWTCPLTPVAERFTTDRRHNFDIYLPEWLAHHNKAIFGALYVGGSGYLLWSLLT